MPELQMPGMNRPDENSQIQASDLSYDFDRLMEDPRGTELVEQILAGDRARRNTMQLSEFSRYEKLFQLNGQEELGPDAYADLATEYFHTISIYDPVTVMEGDNVVMVLPPIFNRYTPISDGGQTGSDINQALINASAREDDFYADEKLRKYTAFYVRMINAVNDPEVQQRNIENARKQAEAALAASKQRMEVAKTPTVTQPEAKPITKTVYRDGKFIEVTESVNEDQNEYLPL